jgi:hypothetical protein
MEELIGKRVQVTGDHPWSGEVGTVKEIKPVNFPIKRTGWIISLDNGMSCFVFDAKQLIILKS